MCPSNENSCLILSERESLQNLRRTLPRDRFCTWRGPFPLFDPLPRHPLRRLGRMAARQRRSPRRRPRLRRLPQLRCLLPLRCLPPEVADAILSLFRRLPPLSRSSKSRNSNATFSHPIGNPFPSSARFFSLWDSTFFCSSCCAGCRRAVERIRVTASSARSFRSPNRWTGFLSFFAPLRDPSARIPSDPTFRTRRGERAEAIHRGLGRKRRLFARDRGSRGWLPEPENRPEPRHPEPRETTASARPRRARRPRSRRRPMRLRFHRQVRRARAAPGNL